MRKDVKLGFAIGGVLLAVLIVYVLVVPGGADKRLTSATSGGKDGKVTLEPVTPPGGATAARTPQQPPPAPEATFTPPATDPFEGPKSGGADGAVARADGGATAPTPAQQPGQALDWNKLLNEQPVMIATTPVPSGPVARTPAARAQRAAESHQPPTAETADITKPGPTPQNTTLPEPAATDTTATAPQLPVPTDGTAKGATSTAQLPPAVDPAGANGNTAASTNGQTTPSNGSATAAGRTHVVQLGETFSSISITEYGNANFYPAIMRANPSVDANRLRPGTKIVLPPIAEVKPAAAAAAAPAAGSNTSGDDAVRASGRIEQPIDPATQYRVQAGDSLYSIAKKLYGAGTRGDKIYQANKQAIGEDMHRLKVGQVLQLPEPPSNRQQASR